MISLQSLLVKTNFPTKSVSKIEQLIVVLNFFVFLFIYFLT